MCAPARLGGGGQGWGRGRLGGPQPGGGAEAGGVLRLGGSTFWVGVPRLGGGVAEAGGVLRPGGGGAAEAGDIQEQRWCCTCGLGRPQSSRCPFSFLGVA